MNTRILALHESVKIPSAASPDDVRNNYVMIGALWKAGFTTGLGGNLVLSNGDFGSSNLANSTIETYQQGSYAGGFNLTGRNCFTCHSTTDGSGNPHPEPMKGTNVSHIFSETVELSLPTS